MDPSHKPIPAHLIEPRSIIQLQLEILSYTKKTHIDVQNINRSSCKLNKCLRSSKQSAHYTLNMHTTVLQRKGSVGALQCRGVYGEQKVERNPFMSKIKGDLSRIAIQGKRFIAPGKILSHRCSSSQLPGRGSDRSHSQHCLLEAKRKLRDGYRSSSIWNMPLLENTSATSPRAAC